MNKDAYYFKHDSNARNDLAIMSMMSDYDLKGYGMFWIIVENLRESRNYKIDETDTNLKPLAYQMRISIDSLKKYIDDCVNIYKLFERGEGFFYSGRLIDDMYKLDAIREKRSVAGKLGGEARWRE